MKQMQTYNPSVGFADNSAKARLRMSPALFRFPYTVEPIGNYECIIHNF